LRLEIILFNPLFWIHSFFVLSEVLKTCFMREKYDSTRSMFFVWKAHRSVMGRI